MKLQITPAQVRNLSLKLTSSTLEECVLHLFDLFEAEGLLSFTKRDLRLPLEAAGWFPLSSHWTTPADLAFWSRVTKSARRGYYDLQPSAEGPTRKLILKMIGEQRIDLNIASRLKVKFPQVEWDDLLSTTHLWLFKWAQNGTCDKYILEGRPPTVAIFTAWVSGKVQQELYGHATNPIMREFGLRTQKEILHRKRTEDSDFIMGGSVIDPDAPVVAWTKSDDDSPARPVFVAPEPDDEVVFSEDQMSLVRDGIRAIRTRAPERYVAMFDAMLNKEDKTALASREGVTVVRVNTLFQKIRADLEHLPQVMEISLKVLDLLAKDPFSTFTEIQEEALISKREAKTVFRFLKLRGLVAEHPGSSFVPTPKGELVMRTRVWAQ